MINHMMGRGLNSVLSLLTVLTLFYRCSAVEPTAIVGERRMHLVGGWQDRSLDDPDVLEMLPSIMSKVNQQSNDAYHLMPIKVLEVQSQVVAGIKYKMRLQVARSQCKKGSNDVIDLKNCIKLEGAPDQIMSLEVWSKPWEGFLQVLVLKTTTLSSN